jgi:hypothetical protein
VQRRRGRARDECPDLLDGELELLRGGAEQLGEFGIGVLAETTLGPPQPEGERDETLLRAVVEVVRDPQPLARRGSSERCECSNEPEPRDRVPEGDSRKPYDGSIPSLLRPLSRG